MGNPRIEEKKLNSVIGKMWDIIFSSERHHLTYYLNLQKEMKVLYICVVLIIALEVLEVKVAQLCLTLCNPMDYTVHGILQARTLEWLAFPFSRGSSQPRDWTQVSHIAGGFFTNWATRSPRILEWVAYPFSRGSSRPRNRTGVSCIAGRLFTSYDS